MFCLLCHTVPISAQFVDIVTAFGFKTSNTDEYYTTCHRQIGYGDGEADAAKVHSYGEHPKALRIPRLSNPLDICFNVRYVQEHGRNDLADPWSFRQTALYQHHAFVDNTSAFVFIQCPSTATESLKHMIQCESWLELQSPQTIHLHFFKTCARDWRYYLNYVSDGLRKVVCS